MGIVTCSLVSQQFCVVCVVDLLFSIVNINIVQHNLVYRNMSLPMYTIYVILYLCTLGDILFVYINSSYKSYSTV